jgi:hypothetical protein
VQRDRDMHPVQLHRLDSAATVPNEQSMGAPQEGLVQLMLLIRFGPDASDPSFSVLPATISTMTPWGKGPLFGDTLAGRTSAKPTMDRDGTIHNCQRRASPQLLAPIVQRSNLSLWRCRWRLLCIKE